MKRGRSAELARPTLTAEAATAAAIAAAATITTVAATATAAAVTWNRHLIHYNADAARAEGHPDVVAQRSLIGNYFARHAGAWLGSAGRVARLSWRVTGSAVPNQGLCCHGVVRERLDGLFEPADLAPGSVPLKYQGWLTAEDGREVAVAEGVLCIHASS